MKVCSMLLAAVSAPRSDVSDSHELTPLIIRLHMMGGSSRNVSKTRSQNSLYTDSVDTVASLSLITLCRPTELQ